MLKALYFLAGAAVGAVASYLITSQVVSKRERDRADKEIEDVKEKLGRRRKAVDTADAVARENESRKEELLDRAIKSRESEAVPEIPENNYSPEELALKDSYREIITKNGYLKRSSIHLISTDDFADPNFEDYHKEYAFSYYKDGTISNELDEELEWHEVEDSIGVDFMAYFRDNPEETECYVRNDDRRIDYVVQRKDELYETTIDPSDIIDFEDDFEGEE